MGEVAVYGHAKRVSRVAQLPESLGQNLLAWHEPHNDVGRPVGQPIADKAEGIGGNEGFASASRHLHAHAGYAGKRIVITRYAALAWLQPVIGEISAVGIGGASSLTVAGQVLGEVVEDLPLVVLELHDYILAISRGICLYRTFIAFRAPSSRTHRSA